MKVCVCVCVCVYKFNQGTLGRVGERSKDMQNIKYRNQFRFLRKRTEKKCVLRYIPAVHAAYGNEKQNFRSVVFPAR